ncbi:MAG: diguanylate cyclase [Gemmatimonadota bacterium]|nr:MAG: diguanylate cyclase [Gemmatimonadota bacterium]
MSHSGEPEWLKILRQRERSSGLATPSVEPPPAGTGGPAQEAGVAPAEPGHAPRATAAGAETASRVEDATPAAEAREEAVPAVAPHPAPRVARVEAAAGVPVSMPTAGGPGHTAEERRRVRTHGVRLATGGLLFALAVVLGLRLLNISPISLAEWVFALVVTGLVQLVVWYLPHRYLDEGLRWDRHYTYIPMLAAALLLSLYMYLAVEPASRLLILMAWFVALLFTAGLAGFIEVTVLSGMMAAGYLVAARLLASRGLLTSFAFEVVVAGVFFGVCVFAAFVFQRLRQERAEARELRRELTEQALTDPLTGLPNRREFERIMLAELDRIRRYGGSCTVAMMDVDYFKNYNDTLGHPAGDALLRELADVITRQMRQSDFFARYGGEEFALVMVNTHGLDGLDVMERVRRHIQTHRFPDEEIQPGGSITISAGLACFPDNGSTYEELISHADQALYVAKSRGRNRVCGP